MKYTCEIIIEKSRAEVISKFDNFDNLKEWMRGLQSYEHLSRVPGEVGAKSKLIFLMGRREIDMIETISVKNLPDEFSGTYNAKGVHKIVSNFFTEIDTNRTLYKTHQEFQFTGFMRLIGFLFPSEFKKQSLQYLQAF